MRPCTWKCWGLDRHEMLCALSAFIRLLQHWIPLICAPVRAELPGKELWCGVRQSCSHKPVPAPHPAGGAGTLSRAVPPVNSQCQHSVACPNHSSSWKLHGQHEAGVLTAGPGCRVGQHAAHRVSCACHPCMPPPSSHMWLRLCHNVFMGSLCLYPQHAPHQPCAVLPGRRQSVSSNHTCSAVLFPGRGIAGQCEACFMLLRFTCVYAFGSDSLRSLSRPLSVEAVNRSAACH